MGEPADGIRNIVIGTPFGEWRNDRVEGEPREAAEFYAALLGWQIVRNDWMKIGTSLEALPHIAFGDGWSDSRPPRWRDPASPTQAHVDIAVPDIPAALAQAGGTTLLEEVDGDHVVLADPLGHPVCLRSGLAADGEPSLSRVVLDCAAGQAGEMASFYDALLADAADGELLAYQEVDGFVETTWPDDDYPAQLHLDLQFADVDAAVARAERLGARRLASPRPNARTFADPAGHPICLCTLTGN